MPLAKCIDTKIVGGRPTRWQLYLPRATVAVLSEVILPGRSIQFGNSVCSSCSLLTPDYVDWLDGRCSSSTRAPRDRFLISDRRLIRKSIIAISLEHEPSN